MEINEIKITYLSYLFAIIEMHCRGQNSIFLDLKTQITLQKGQKILKI